LAHRVELRAPEPLSDVLHTCLSGVSIDPTVHVDETIDLNPTGDGRWLMSTDGVPTSVGADAPARVLVRLLEHLNRAAAVSVADAIPFHAAAVAVPDGRVVLLAGSSGSGKSTLCAAAVRDGWRFVAEEVAAVDPAQHAVHPYHRPIGLRPGGAAALGVEPPVSPWFDEVYPWCPPPDSRASGGTLAAIAVVDRTAGVRETFTYSPAAALTELIRHTVVPDDDRVVVEFHRLARMVRDVPVVRLPAGTIAEGLAAIERLDET